MPRDARLVVVVAALGTLACGGAREAVHTEPVHTESVRGTPVATASPPLTTTPPPPRADSPACFAVTDLPAISSDGQAFDAFVTLPT
jgi:hypothetical protein